jgi:hypothetical protein
VRNGPAKIIMINAGKFDYAEVSLDGAIQIVGDNNWGKTTLINTLQFLYFDERAKFGLGTYSPDETLNYYFPNEHSYVLFECRTLRGQVVIGWRGASKTSAADPERFFYLGPFRNEDFFDENSRIRKPREISALLAAREFQLLAKPADHRAILLSGAGQRHNGLGIVALNNGERYSDFRETFRNLLNLTHIEQEQMRERLLMLAGLPTDYVAIDAHRVLGEDYDDLMGERDTIKAFQAHQDEVRRVITLFNRRQLVWAQLNYRWEDLKARKKQFDEIHAGETHALTEKITKAKEAVTTAKNSLAVKRGEKEGLLEQKAPIEADLKKLEANKKHYAGFPAQLEQAALESLDRQLNNLLNRQQEASAETPESVREQLDAAENRVSAVANSIEHFSRLAITALRAHFSDEQISHLFRLFNPDLLGLPTGRGSITMTSPAQVVENLRQVASRIVDGVYQDDSITVQFGPSADLLAKFQNVEALEKELDRENKNVERLTALLEAVTQRETISKMLEELKAKKGAQAEKLAAYHQYELASASESEWRKSVETLGAAIQAAQTAIDGLDAALEATRGDLLNLSNQKTSTEGQYAAVLKRYNDCHGKIAIFNVAPRADAEIPEDFDSAVSFYLSEYQRQLDLTRDFQSAFSGLGVFADRYKNNDETKMISDLEQELDALPKREEALELRWKGHIHGLKGRFQEVLNDLRLVENAKNRLNTEFARVRISDLKAVKLTVERQMDEVSLIERLASLDELKLMGDTAPLNKIVERVRRKMSQNPVTHIAELFALGVTVTRADGTVKKHPDIHQVESDGTTVTIKVLFNLLVLKSLLHKEDVAVPFFLDEIERLDTANRGAIIRTAKELGFIAITAAPSAVGEVDSCYFLEPDERGRIVLTDAQRLSLKSKAEPTAHES